MLLVLALAAAVWFGGAYAGVSRWPRLALVGLVLAVGITWHLYAGGDPAPWIVLGLLAALVAVWRIWVGWLRAHAAPPAPAPVSDTLRPEELTRYARHIALREIGGAGQKRLRSARVLVVGAGGLGSPVCLYLAAAGVGTVGVVDDDVVEATNLQRQIIHVDQRLGMPKVFSAEAAMKALNPYVTVRPYNRRLTAEIAASLFADYDLILDGSDNFETRELVNATCVKLKLPLIAGSLAQWEGQVSLYHPPEGPCLHCVFPVRPAPGMVPTCAEAGVAAPLPGVVGSIMAVEAVKHMTGAGQTLTGRLMLYDALYGEVRTMVVQRDPGCVVCGATSA